LSGAVFARDWRADLERSREAFREIVWPEIAAYVGGGALVSLEDRGDDDLDRTGGIDAYERLETGIRTIAQRTQFIDDYQKPQTFTIRCARRHHTLTEFHKRYDAINQGFDLPGLVIQAYVHEERRQLMRVGITHGRPFYEYVFRQVDRWSTRHNSDGSAAFLVIPWVAISKDNAAGRSNVPLLAKDVLGVVHRTPDTFFSRPLQAVVFDLDARFLTSGRRQPGLLQI
jgi:hypothetical protein